MTSIYGQEDHGNNATQKYWRQQCNLELLVTAMQHGTIGKVMDYGHHPCSRDAK